MGKPEFRGEQEAQTVEIVKRIDGQDISITQRLEIRCKEAYSKIARVSIPPRGSGSDSRGSYTPSDDFDMLHYMGGDSNRESRITSVPRDTIGITDNFSHDFDTPWYQGRI